MFIIIFCRQLLLPVKKGEKDEKNGDSERGDE